MLRVIAGSAGGRKLVAPKGDARPTADRVKEALFASLGHRIDGATVLDLYSGSGALALEALSRGARRAVLVDRGRASEQAVRENLARTGFEGSARFQRSPVVAFLADEVPEAPFDVVLLDPPYRLASAEVAAVLAVLAGRPLLVSGATVVLERPRGAAPVALPAGWEIEKERAYGDTLLVVAHAG